MFSVNGKHCLDKERTGRFQENSLKLNMLLNTIKNMMGILFPFITFPYASKILGIDNIGKYNFSNSVISYFLLIAELGIGTYAIREGAKLRGKKTELNCFVSEIFTINLISTVISYLLLMICLLNVSKFESYREIIVIMSLQIVFKTIGMDYIYSIFEDYFYITIRTIIFQVISLIFLFLFVKTSDDIIQYTMVYVFSNICANISNFVFARKYCNVKITKKVNIKKHLKPIIILFGMSATVAVYVASDITILGFLCSDTVVGRYSVSAKVYSIVKTVLSAILVVSIPRLSAYLGKNEYTRFRSTLEDIYKTLLTFMLPAIIGIILLRKPIILLISDEEFIGAESSLLLLAIALFFCMGAWFWGQCVLVPLGQEKIVFKITVISAVINIILNFIMIPAWQENAAALTTAISEGFSYVCCVKYGRRYVKTLNLSSCILKVMVGCMPIAVICIGTDMLIKSSGMTWLFVDMIVSVIAYLIVEFILKNEVIYHIAEDKVKFLRHRN